MKQNKKTKILIVEGVDCSGKDFIINSLSKRLKNSILIKSNYKPINYKDKNKIKEKYKIILKAVELLSKKSLFNYNYIILNRFFPSELAYSGVKRDYEALRDKWYLDFEKKLIENKKLCFILVYIFDDNEKLSSRIKERKDDYVEEEDIKDLSARYEFFYDRTKLKKIKLKSGEIEKLMEFVENG